MIKRIRLATSKQGTEDREFGHRWSAAVAATAAAPGPTRPVRLTVAIALTDILADQIYDGVGLEWFTDEEHLLLYEAWLRSPDGAVAGKLLSEAVELDASPVVVTDERVVRGTEYLDRRWAEGGPRLKHVAIARRAAGLTLPQFLDLWRSRAGKIGATPIPDAYRGLAYLQNHPLVMSDRDWAYDAINEVYFNPGDTESLLARIAYFDRELAAGDGEKDLVGANWFLAVREEPVAATR